MGLVAPRQEGSSPGQRSNPCPLPWQPDSFYLFILAALHLGCCLKTFSSCGEQESLFVAFCGLLIAVASLVEHGLEGRAQQFQLAGSRAGAQ